MHLGVSILSTMFSSHVLIGDELLSRSTRREQYSCTSILIIDPVSPWSVRQFRPVRLQCRNGRQPNGRTSCGD